MKYNYPIKYAIMPIKSEPTYGNNYESETLCYIITKCYLLKEYIKYDSEGFGNKTYEVQFPYRKEEYGWKRIVPYTGESYLVDKVYDSLEDACHDTKIKYNELIDDQIFYTKEQVEEYGKKLQEAMDEYSELEKLINENTKDLIVGNKPKSQKFTSLYLSGESDNSRKGRFEIGSYTIYDLFRGYDSINDYIVYSVSEEEYNEYKKLPFYDYQRFTHTPLLSHKGHSSVVTVLNGDESIHLACTDGEIKPVNPEEGLSFDKPNLIIFTMETYEDIVNSYGLNNKYKKVLNLTQKK